MEQKWHSEQDLLWVSCVETGWSALRFLKLLSLLE